jgi:predicted TIM-barrel fold metal-dependent hydrolase
VSTVAGSNEPNLKHRIEYGTAYSLRPYEEVCEALVASEGNVYLAADRLRVGSLILRKFIERSSRARAVIREMCDRLNDEAQTTLREALRDPDARRRDWAIRYILNSQNAKKLGSLMKDLGWHMQLWIDVKDLPETIPTIKSIGLPVVIDHMGRTDARAGINTAGVQSLVRLLGEGGCWVKMSGAHRLSTRAPDYPDARPFHEALIAANPDQLIWGTDWPHPRIEGEMPNAGHLLDLFNEWTSDESLRRKILVTNPARLYGFSS